MTAEKICRGCGALRPLSDYYKRKSSKDGHYAQCKECKNAKAREYVERNREQVLEYKRQWAEANRELMISYQRKWYEANREQILERVRDYSQTEHGKGVHRRALEKYADRYPERVVATRRVNNAIRDGRLFPEPCEMCGDKAQAHHDDYEKPLEVRWLCASHHAQTHRELRAS